MTIWLLAIWLAQGAAPPDPAVLAASLDREAAAALAAGQFDDAERACRRSLHLWQEAARTRPVDLTPARVNLAEVLLHQGKLAGAEAEARRAGDPATPGPAAARLQSLYAKIDFHSGRYREAEQRQAAALELLESQAGTNVEDLASALNDLAMIVATREDYHHARTLAGRAAAMLRAAGRGGGTSYGIISGNLALFCFRMGDLDAADALYRESVAALRENLGAGHPHLGVVMAEHAQMLRKAGRKSEAKLIDREAKAILDVGWPARHTIDVRTLKNRELSSPGVPR